LEIEELRSKEALPGEGDVPSPTVPRAPGKNPPSSRNTPLKPLLEDVPRWSSDEKMPIIEQKLLFNVAAN
jgi:hypothetical protein